MKKTLLLACLLGFGFTLQAQQSDNDDADAFKMPGKVARNAEKIGIAQLTVSYKLTSTESTIGKERSTGKMGGAKLTAYLETTDGELTSDDFQEVTDYFYNYFQSKLKSSGIDTVAWNTIAATDFYKSADEKTMSNDKEGGGNQVWVNCNAHKGNILYNGTAAFAFGKIKRASHFCEDIGAAAGFFYVTLDFADILVDMKISTSGPSCPSGYYPYTVTTSYKYHSATKPEMKILPSDAMSLLWNEKSQSQSVFLQQPLRSSATYHTAVNQDRSRIKNRAFAFAKSMDPVVIETTREQYKAAAKKALERYADVFVNNVSEARKG